MKAPSSDQGQPASLTGPPERMSPKPGDTVVDLKSQIQDKEGIPPTQQCLVAAGRQLADELSTSTAGTQNQSVLHLSVRILGGRIIRLQKLVDETVQAVKREILQRESIPVDKQQLFFAGTELENHQKLSACGIQDDGVLDLLTDTPSLTGPPVGMMLFVKTLTGRTVVLSPKPGDMVLDLKSQIQDKEGTPPKHQCLVSAGRELADKLSISTAGLQNQSVLHMVFRLPRPSLIQVTVEASDGRSFEVDTNVEDTVENVKVTLEEEGGVAKGDQTLLFGGSPLEDGRTLWSYDIRDGSTLHLEYPQSQ